MLWSNGCVQNAVHLALLMQRLPEVEVGLVAYPWGDMPEHPLGKCFNIPTINDRDAAMKLDVIIELGIRLENEFTPFFREKGGRLVNYMAGNVAVMNFESLFLDGEPALRGSVVSPVGFDAVWITPQHMRMNAEMTRALYGTVEEAPHIWSPAALEHSMKSLGLTPAFVKRPEKWSLASFDPNINVVKSFHMPLLVADAAHKQAPDKIRRMMLFCTDHLKGRLHFESFIAATSLGFPKVTAESRHMIVAMLGKEVDAVITHQWENDLNYLYWDVMSLGYPLIHNSARIKGAGYYYPDFDPETGGLALLDAIASHSQKRECDIETVWRYHIGNDANQVEYLRLLQKVLDGPKA